MPPRLGATLALAHKYATLIDEARETYDVLVSLNVTDDSIEATVEALKAKVEAQAVACEIGPKYLSALAALGMTTSAKGVTQGVPSPGQDALSKLRAKHAASRKNGA